MKLKAELVWVKQYNKLARNVLVFHPPGNTFPSVSFRTQRARTVLAIKNLFLDDQIEHEHDCVGVRFLIGDTTERLSAEP